MGQTAATTMAPSTLTTEILKSTGTVPLLTVPATKVPDVVNVPVTTVPAVTTKKV